jgi:hypothetical protein
MVESEDRKGRSTRGKWIDWYALISPVLLIPFTNWYGYELFGGRADFHASRVRLIASFSLLLGTALSGSIASAVAAIRKRLPGSLLYWLAAVIDALAFIFFCDSAWGGILSWAMRKYRG